MSLQIEGGLSGKKLDINSRNMARVISAELSPQYHNAITDLRTWTISDTQTPTGAADEFLYIRNDNSRHSLVISRLQFNAASAETVLLAAATGTPAGGTALVPVNRTLGSSNSPIATIQSGVDITGLTLGAALEIWEGTAGDSIDLAKRPIVIPPNQAVALSAVTGAIAIQFLVDIYTQLVEPAEL